MPSPATVARTLRLLGAAYPAVRIVDTGESYEAFAPDGQLFDGELSSVVATYTTSPTSRVPNSWRLEALRDLAQRLSV